MKDSIKGYMDWVNEDLDRNEEVDRPSRSGDWFATDTNPVWRWELGAGDRARLISRDEADWGPADEMLAWSDFTERYGDLIPRGSRDGGARRVRIWRGREPLKNPLPASIADALIEIERILQRGTAGELTALEAFIRANKRRLSSGMVEPLLGLVRDSFKEAERGR